MKDAPRQARSKVTTEDKEMAIVAAAVYCPTASVRKIKNSAGLEGMSDTAVKHHLYDAGLKPRTAAQQLIVKG